MYRFAKRSFIMYEDLIDSLKPKPSFNLKWYENEDKYTEGDIEDTIINIIAENAPEDYVAAIAKNYCWSVYYHLTPVRRNILNWYPFNPDSSVLEIGCGLGAITGLLCDKVRDVTAVEMSKRRAAGALLRCRDKSNLEIIVGNLNDITFDKKFDYITLIGVLEYQGRYTDSANPYRDFLTKIRSLLSPNGKLLIAIENQYGLKYWCGAKEDHTGLPFEGINQYEHIDGSVRTFSRKSLEALIKSSGYTDTYFYYPQPDYKLPYEIYSQDQLPGKHVLDKLPFYYAPDSKTLVADEEYVYDDLIDNGVFEFFANSFLVECSNGAPLGEVTCAISSRFRRSEYTIATRFMRDGHVEKYPISAGLDTQAKSASYNESRAHIAQTHANLVELSKRGLKTVPETFDGNVISSEYMHAPTLHELMTDAYIQGDTERFFGFFDMVYGEILRSSEEVSWENNLLYALKKDAVRDRSRYGKILKFGYIDMTLKNAFLIDGCPHWFDQEWMLENVPAGFVMYRVLVAERNACYGQMQKFPFDALVERYGLKDVADDYAYLADLFQDSVTDQFSMQESNGFIEGFGQSIINNISRLIQ